MRQLGYTSLYGIQGFAGDPLVPGMPDLPDVPGYVTKTKADAAAAAAKEAADKERMMWAGGAAIGGLVLGAVLGKLI